MNKIWRRNWTFGTSGRNNSVILHNVQVVLITAALIVSPLTAVAIKNRDTESARADTDTQNAHRQMHSHTQAHRTHTHRCTLTHRQTDTQEDRQIYTQRLTGRLDTWRLTASLRWRFGQWCSCSDWGCWPSSRCHPLGGQSVQHMNASRHKVWLEKKTSTTEKPIPFWDTAQERWTRKHFRFQSQVFCLCLQPHHCLL